MVCPAWTAWVRRNALVAQLVPSALIVLWIFWSVPQYELLYRGLEVTLPSSTQFLFANYPLASLVPVSMLVTWWLWPTSLSRDHWVTAGTIANLLLLGVVLWAAISPSVNIRLHAIDGKGDVGAGVEAAIGHSD